MKKQEESSQIDELFARKLGNASLSPSPDGFERLQARMNKAQPEARAVIWHNAVVQRYVAIAACLLLVCLFGWLYWQSADSESIQRGEQVANSISKQKNTAVPQSGNPLHKTTMDNRIDKQPVQAAMENQLAAVNKPVKITQKNNPSKYTLGQKSGILSAAENEQSVTNQLVQNDDKANVIDATLPAGNTTNSADANAERVAGNAIKPAALTERVLTVTIEEPTLLKAARQTPKKESPAMAASAEKADNETKGSLWQQVKRIKQGEVFARRDNPVNEDQGLLGRAYSGLKQSFEKDKSEK